MDNLGKFEVVDILYADNGKGPYKTSKVGEKYDFRKNRTYRVYLTNAGWLDMLEINDDEEYTGFMISTTLYVNKYMDEEFVYLKTVNSIYKCLPKWRK